MTSITIKIKAETKEPRDYGKMFRIIFYNPSMSAFNDTILFNKR